MIAAKYRSKFLRSLVRAKINTNNHIPALVANRIFTSSLRVASATQPPNSQPQQRLAINPEKCTTTATTRRIFSSTRALLDNKKAFRSQEQYEKEQEQELAKELPQTKTITAQNLSFEKISQGRHDITFNWAKVPLQVSLLGLLSPLPATYFALQVAMSGNAEFFMGMHQTYAAVLLSFIGAIHWGTVIPKMQSMPTDPAELIVRQHLTTTKPDTTPENATFRLLWGIVPSLIACAAFASNAYSLNVIIMSVGFAVAFGFDLLASLRGWTPQWYPALRMPLTGIMILSMWLALAFYHSEKTTEDEEQKLKEIEERRRKIKQEQPEQQNQQQQQQ
eukprot:GEZU01005487.1.p1 GENE.GEZU01005487.1~~GEZU01005487.1.p1  ORF type:complete len:334 (-),score=102.27 GEZU01005487.1:147-1148(-)